MVSFATTSGLNYTHSLQIAQLNLLLAEKEYRHGYVFAQTSQFLARQMREFRGELSQVEFGRILDKPQSVVSRLEDPNYGKWTLQSLFEVARKLDVAVLVRFVDFPTFATFVVDWSDPATRPDKYNQVALNKLAIEAERQPKALEAFNEWTTEAVQQKAAFAKLQEFWPPASPTSPQPGHAERQAA